MAKKRRLYSEKQMERLELYDYLLADLETAADSVCKQLEAEGLSKKSAYKKTKELLRQVAQYGF